MRVVKVHWIRRYKCGYELRCEDVEHADCITKITSAYTPHGHYIGNARTARYFVKKLGIMPEPISPDYNICTIGYSHIDGKWYGWSHRAIHGFKVGDKVKYGDCAYTPKDADYFIYDIMKSLKGKKGLKVIKGQGKVTITWVGNSKGHEWEYPGTYGRGEWVAKTTADVRQMAVDFARGVS